MEPQAAAQLLRRSRMILTVTPGRSGTKLLSRILDACPGMMAEHEAAPMVNFVLRTAQSMPLAALWWLRAEKLPAIAARLAAEPPGTTYADTSHLYAKGFLEPLLQMRICPDLILLTRPARAVAQSLLAVGAVPVRSGPGRLVLVGPDDPGVVAPETWDAWDDYQLCFWYVREMERRQREYARLWPDTGGRILWLSMTDLTDPARLGPLFEFVTGDAEGGPEPERLAEILAVNQNPKSAVTPNWVTPQTPPADIDGAEAAVDAALAGD